MNTLILRKLFYILTLVLFSTSIFAQPAPPSGKMWQKQSNLSDEFNAGFDTGKWQKPLWNYGEPVNMVSQNSGVSGGNLWIKATLGSGSRWFNGSRVMSNAQIKYPFYTEARIKSANISAYSTFWLNNGDINNRDEIDIIENNPNPSCNCQPNFPWQMNSQYFQVANGDTKRNTGNFDNRNLPNGAPGKGVRWNEAYFTFGVWQKDARNIQFYLNGYPAGSVVSARDFTRDMNIIWDLWTGDFSWLGGLAVKSQLNNNSMNTMYVDWIHTYKLVNGNGGGGSSSSAPSGGNTTTTTIQAENFTKTGGTFNDSSSGGPGLGVNNAGNGISFVNGGDWVDYSVYITQAGNYEIVYNIATPLNGGTVEFLVDGSSKNTSNVPNTGSWDTYKSLTASQRVNLSAGQHTIRLKAGANTWQWNLDKFTIRGLL
jgi:beta-agarase